MGAPHTDTGTPLLVLGGARSGKSSWAEGVVGRFDPPYVYVATAQALDDEMKVRIRLHRERREGLWRTIEAPVELATVLEGLKGRGEPVLVDCITLWLSNLLCSETSGIEGAVDRLCETIRSSDYPLVIVSNETGAGIVPENALARRFRDLSGFTNQKLAAACASVFLIVAGLPMRLKG
ncbi:MAG: bifunctional adenosylcobinamide kinase/adenosylcobinamide-phosphate guanylyltransferase [Syntrophobacteraceae bacterium]|nr:bifunctional adenosylcobinamide kinase/adenosylcobinamide-phosphate guanylyltransferase [Syntrophobacteraceae bacterium]